MADGMNKSPLCAVFDGIATQDSAERLEVITDFDSAVLFAVTALCERESGGAPFFFSYPEIWQEMGNREKMTSQDHDEMDNSLDRIAKCWVDLKRDAPRFLDRNGVCWRGFNLISYRRMTIEQNGQRFGFVEIIAKPFWQEIARARGVALNARRNNNSAAV